MRSPASSCAMVMAASTPSATRNGASGRPPPGGALRGDGPGPVDAAGEAKRRLGPPARGSRPVRHDDDVVDPARGRAVPAVRQVEDMPADDRHSDLVPVRTGVL